ncbi:PqiC family protein [Endozoicomonadaceae bacterium StTr2]
MKTRSVLMSGLLLILLAGCASQTARPVYLLLGDPTSHDMSSRSSLDKLTLTVAPYLDQPQLAIVSGPNQVQFSNAYLWAEPLSLSLKELLRQKLETFRARAAEAGLNADISVYIRRLNFSPSGRVSLSGEYSLHWDNKLLVKRGFNLGRDSGTSSYPTMVPVVEQLLEQLAADIHKEWPQQK